MKDPKITVATLLDALMWNGRETQQFDNSSGRGLPPSVIERRVGNYVESFEYC